MSTQKALHTPLPWLVAEGVDRGSVVIISAEIDDAIIASMGQDMPEDAVNNARFIIQCVQSHDALVEAATFARNFIENSVYSKRSGEEKALDLLDAALRLAE